MNASGLQEFVALVVALDRTTATNEKLTAIERYLAAAPPLDAVWAIHFLTGRRVRRAVPARALRACAAAWTEIPEWLVESSYHAVGDLAETLAILCARGEGGDVTALSLAAFVEQEVATLAREGEREQRARLFEWWRAFDEPACFVVHKLLTGAFRIGVSATLVARALAKVLGREPAQVAHRLMGTWSPGSDFAHRLFSADDADADRSRPYPFYLASPLEDDVHTLGAREQWLAEWKWDGIRVQLIRRGDAVFLWSRGEELITERFPEITLAARALPAGTVLDGELVPWRDGAVLPFGVLQTRIGRTNLTRRVLREAPVALLAFDLLELDGDDIREQPQGERRLALERVLGTTGPNSVLRLSPLIDAPSWEALRALRATSRERSVEGVMLKQVGAPYRVGRPRGEWWKWKIDPYTVDAVMVYAQAGHGRRASLHTDYTFAVWDGETLVPVAKAYSGLTDEEIGRLDAWVRANTLQRFGPVRAVPPHHVFELGFEGIQDSPRHKAGVALRFPRILRWRTDKPVGEASTLAELRALIAPGAHRARRRVTMETSDAPSLFDVPNVEPDYDPDAAQA